MSVEEKIVKALEVYGTHTPDDVRLAIEEGRMQSWMRDGTIVVTTVKDYPQLRACELFMVAGDLQTAWAIHDEEIIPWARGVGCSRMVGRGRKGWLKTARQNNYGKEMITVVREI